ncbi:Ig-like domain-containing protein [Paludisphaera rhizosphaerae]|uniref:Ig-like domain-containing protein n=1 Tax=Paludisphaera rhizosphaerae TaxID=2711216 RepID=UPI0013EBCA77|nr:Ig-like domain-containing protein [Paludisphaera rhizosphaerae]
MDRRRFIPGPENMEGRMMLSTATAALTTTATTTNLPYTIQQKLERIDRLPTNLRALNPNRPLPKELITGIQEGMTQALSSLGSASPTAVKMFNNVLRDVVSRPSLRAQDAQALNNALTQVLVSAGATTSEIDLLSTNLKTLATTVNTTQSEPVFLTTNDYATVLQMTLIVGRPMPAPSVPSIARASGHQVDAQHSVTTQSQPEFLGTYQAQATMQIIDADTNEVYGQAPAGQYGHYTLTLSTPLDLGTHRLRIRAVDELGHVGKSSGVFIVKVVAPHTT